MKKTTNMITLIFAALAVISSIVAPCLISDASATIWVIGILLAVSAVGLWACPSVLKSKILTVVPVVAIMVLSNYIKSIFETALDEIAVTTSSGEYETLGLMLTVAFVVAMVFAFNKGFKWAIISSVVYSALMLVSQAKIMLMCLSAMDAVPDNSTMVAPVLIALAFVFASAAQISMFAALEKSEKSAPDSDAQEASEE